MNWFKALDKKLQLILISSSALVLVLLLAIMTLQLKVKKTQPAEEQLQDQNNELSQQGLSERVPPPKVSLLSYENRATLPILPQEALKLYEFKTSFSTEDARAIGAKLGLKNQRSLDNRFLSFYNFNEPNTMGVLVFDRETGSFNFRSYGNLALGGEGSLLTRAQRFLFDSKITDLTVTCDVSYKRKEFTPLTFIECHRLWARTGLPILNPVGLLNLKEEQSLNNIKLGVADNNLPEDRSITAVSTGIGNGRIRPNDFNTVTIAVTDDGRIFSIDSNLRRIKKISLVSRGDLLTPQEALDQFLAHGSTFRLTLPAGSGVVNWNKVYPTNQVRAIKATISDHILAYFEAPGGVRQTAAAPSYLIRGTAELESGYTVKFIEILPAIKTELSKIRRQRDVAGASTGFLAQATQKLGTIDEEISPSTTIVPTNPPQEELKGKFKCELKLTDQGGKKPLGLSGERFEFQLDIPGVGSMTIEAPKGAPHTLFFTSASFPANSRKELMDAFFKAVGMQYAINSARRYQSEITSAKTLEDIHAFFERRGGADQIEEKPIPALGLVDQTPAVCQGGDITPVPKACWDKIDRNAAGIDPSRLEQAYNYAAETLLEYAKTGKLAELSARNNLFPDRILEHFSWIFWNSDENNSPYSHWNGGSSCYITGVSPTLYIYSDHIVSTAIILPKSINYTYPSAFNGIWNVVSSPNSYSRLYYEYDKDQVKFSSINKGFIIESRGWEEFVRRRLAKKLGLTPQETEDLVKDFKKLGSFTKPFLRISIADKNEVDEKLPLNIIPAPDRVERIHFMVKLLNKKITIKEPTLTPIARGGYFVLELGVTAGND